MAGRTPWDGDDYAARVEERLRAVEAAGGSRHGEADLVCAFDPTTVLDAGCGTGRVAIELARRGISVTGVDVDASMLENARRASGEVAWVEADLTGLDLGRHFDVVVMAGNVPLFTPPGTEDALVANAARHVTPGGRLIAGFQLDRSYSLARYDGVCHEEGLELERRFATWEGAAFEPGASYAVSVHRRPAASRS